MNTNKKITIDMKSLIVVIIAAILAILIGLSYAWLNITKKSEIVNKITAGNLELTLDDTTSEGIKLTKEVPRSYQQGMTTKEYTFTLTNKSSTSSYTLSLKDLNTYTNDNNEEVIITDEDRLADSKIRYILLKDGEEATASKSKILTDRVIDSGTIEKGKTIKYSLRIWIDSRAGNGNKEAEVMGKIFNAQLSLEATQTVTPTKTAVCKRATTLHTEECSQTDTSSYCSGDGYTASGSMKTTTITYGNLGTKGTLTSGDAFDCDVNGDGVYDSATERFYYVSDMTNGVTQDSNTAVLIYYNNVSGGVASNSTAYAYDSSGKNNNGPVTAIKQLPTTEQWSNVSLANTTRTILDNFKESHTLAGELPNSFSYFGYAARLLTYQEIEIGCSDEETNKDLTLTASLSTKCKYLMENTKYSSENLKTYGEWLESPYGYNSNSAWYLYSGYRRANCYNVNTSDNYGVRPAIEVAKTDIDY